MAELEPLVDRAMVEARWSPALVQRVLNDYGQGSPSDDAIALLIEDASSKVRGYVGPIVNLEELDAVTAPEVRRLTLDVVGALMALRHPEVVRKDGEKLMKLAERDLERIREGKSDFGSEDQPTLANEGATAVSGDPRRPDCIPRRFSDNWGDF